MTKHHVVHLPLLLHQSNGHLPKTVRALQSVNMSCLQVQSLKMLQVTILLQTLQ